MNTAKNIELSEKLVITGMDCKTNTEALKMLSDKLFNANYVKKTFFENVIKREQNFPTGIKTKTIGIAMPHTDSEYVNKSTISIGVLKNPVIFHQMTNENETVEVNIIFLLALADAKKHLNVLQNLVEIIKDENTLNSMIQMNKKEIIDLLNRYIN